MNERIRQLADESGLRFTQLMSNPMVPIVDGKETDLAKFAQLIVRECVEIGDNYQDILGNEPECFNCRKVAYGIVDKIKQHFGVEE
jgi:hypothetical protein